MNNNNFGDKINNIINDAVNTMDFGKLNRDINSTVKDALFGSEIKLSKDDSYENLSKERPSSSVSRKVPVNKKPSGTYSGMIMIVCGVIGMALFGIFSLASFLLAGITSLNFTSSGIVLLCCTVASFVVTIKGISIRKRLNLFKNYSRIMNNNEFFEIKDLSAHCEKNEKALVQDLNKMIKLGMFKEGHIDDTKKWFIGNDVMYQKYLNAKDSFENRQKQDKAETQSREGESEQERKLRMVLEKGKESIEQIRNANIELTGEEISIQLTILENLVTRIFARVEEKPALLPDIRKFMDYYLPTTLKLVNVYRGFENKSVQSNEILKAKSEIEETLQTIQIAFEKLLNELYEDTIMDISTDISVLKTMFARDGLADKDFK